MLHRHFLRCFVFCLLAHFSPLVSACSIAGADTGVCTDPGDFDLLLPFCKAVIPYTACLPRYQSLWYNHSALAKDTFVQQMYTKLVTMRKMYESNSTLQKRNMDEWGGDHEIIPRFTDNADCENAFRNYFCWMNFPRCDAEGKSLLLCRSVCENYMTACQLSSDLWRCGDPKYINGREPEVSTTWMNQQLVYYRAPYPGSPFKDYTVDPDTDKPIVVCTPSLENAGRRPRPTLTLVMACLCSLVLGLLQHPNLFNAR